MPKIILSAVIIVAVTSIAFARDRILPAGPEDYVDDSGFWHSLNSDWPNIQRAEVSGQNRRPSHKHRLSAR
jgi:hypothetical protein